VHWFTDVLAGLIFGWTWFAVCSIAFGGRLLHFGAPAEQAQRAVESDQEHQQIVFSVDQRQQERSW
jgi:membrane-associated phospholipid phosphatase